MLLPFVPGTVQDAWPQAAQARLTQCMLLALLLHVWLVLMLGSAPPGTALPGQGVGGAINITLRGPAQDGVAAIGIPPVPPPPGLPGTAPVPRSGGAVRAPGPPPLAQPGAAQLGDWAARQAPEGEAAADPPPQPPAVPDAVSSPAPASVAPVAERRLAAQPGNGAPSPMRSAPLARLPAAAEAPVRLAWPDLPPQAPPLAAQAPALPATAAPVLPMAAARVVPAAEAPVLPTGPAPVAPAAAVPEVPASPAPPVRRIEPIAAAPPGALSPLPPTAGVAPAVLPQAATLPGVPAAGALAGNPAAGVQLGHDVATAPSAPASAPPRLNLQLVRPRGGELSRGSAAGVLPLLARPPELPDKLARDIEKAGKSDCRSAYGGMGILAVVPLARDAVSGSGKDGACKW